MSKLLIYNSYLKMIKNAVGTKMFRNLYLGKKDITKNGRFSCAFFVSNILLIWGLISKGHATVESTIEDMKRNGWKKVPENKAKPGNIIIWEKVKGPNNKMHFHNGFYIGNKKAISTSNKTKTPIVHSWDYNGKRKIIAIYNHPKLKA